MTEIPYDDPRWKALAAPFPADEIEQLPRQVGRYNKDAPWFVCREGHQEARQASADGVYCGGRHQRSFHLSYVGHAGITSRLLEVDPGWTWEPVATTDAGTPMMTDGGLWIRLTVLGVTRLGFGDPGKSAGPNGVKEVIGDALRNAAMRFGVGTYLWGKSEKAERLKAGQFGDEPDDAPAPEPEAAKDDAAQGFHEATAREQLQRAWDNPEGLNNLGRWYSRNVPDTPPGFLEAIQRRLGELAAASQQDNTEQETP